MCERNLSILYEKNKKGLIVSYTQWGYSTELPCN